MPASPEASPHQNNFSETVVAGTTAGAVTGVGGGMAVLAKPAILASVSPPVLAGITALGLPFAAALAGAAAAAATLNSCGVSHGCGKSPAEADLSHLPVQTQRTQQAQLISPSAGKHR